MGRISAVIPEKLKARFERLKLHKETTAQLLQRLIHTHEQNQVINGLELQPAERQEVEEAIEQSGLAFAQIAKQGLLTRARALKAYAQKLTTVDLNDKSQATRFFGIARARIEQKVAELMAQATTPITQQVISKATNANLKAIKNYLAEHQAEIATYNLCLAEQQRKAASQPKPANPPTPSPNPAKPASLTSKAGKRKPNSKMGKKKRKNTEKSHRKK